MSKYHFEDIADLVFEMLKVADSDLAKELDLASSNPDHPDCSEATEVLNDIVGQLEFFFDLQIED